ncbi:MAG: hypothetical protein CMJ27_02570 [Phycisphaerae bacterium]|nr:hypothetical protein [Phycisphaerae bacterium]
MAGGSHPPDDARYTIQGVRSRPPNAVGSVDSVWIILIILIILIIGREDPELDAEVDDMLHDRPSRSRCERKKKPCPPRGGHGLELFERRCVPVLISRDDDARRGPRHRATRSRPEPESRPRR